jgi:thioester reductase-like protein
MAEKLPQSLRQRLVPLFKEILAYHWVEDLTFNRLSGAVYHVLLSEENSRLTEDAAVDLAVNLTRRERLPELLARYDALVQKREEQARKQVLGIVNNMIPEDTPNRAQVVQGTLDMLQKFTLVRSITGIRTLVQARIDNLHQDVDEDEYLMLT